MPMLTIGRAAKLYGMHRSTLYEAVAKGRVSAGVDGKGQRVIDLAEMIRRYGEPPDATRQNPTPTAEAAGALQDTALQPLLDELRLLREEVAQLRQTLLLLEHRPAAPVAALRDEPALDAELAEILGNMKARHDKR